MGKIGLFYGTDTGNTERIAKKIKELIDAKLGDGTVDVLEIYKKKKEDMAAYELLILGMPTWYDGELQGDWESFIPEMQQIDFAPKKVAFFGLGDQYGYSNYFVDALQVFGELVESKGGKLYGLWPVTGYEHDYSKAQRGDLFLGLALDVDNQDDLTDTRVQNWVTQVLGEFGLTGQTS